MGWNTFVYWFCVADAIAALALVVYSSLLVSKMAANSAKSASLLAEVASHVNLLAERANKNLYDRFGDKIYVKQD